MRRFIEEFDAEEVPSDWLPDGQATERNPDALAAEQSPDALAAGELGA